MSELVGTHFKNLRAGFGAKSAAYAFFTRTTVNAITG
jgi:hypothetical protein